MGWSIPILRVAGIQLRIHITFLLLIAWIAFAYYSQGGSSAAVDGVLFILLLFACVVLHEFGHALAGKAFGINTPDITLLPIGGVARLERIPDEPVQELVIAAAGPAVTALIALGAFIGGGSWDYPPTTKTSIPDLLFTMNVMLLLFNLLPAFPMDGGRVLRALLATRLSYARATQIAATVGQGFAFVFGFFGLLFNPFLNFHRAVRLHRGVARGGAGANERCLAPVSSFQRNGARVPHPGSRCDARRSSRRIACDFAARFSGHGRNRERRRFINPSRSHLGIAQKRSHASCGRRDAARHSNGHNRHTIRGCLSHYAGVRLPGRARAGSHETAGRLAHSGERHRTNDGAIGDAAAASFVSR